jgi:hypothetical protein
VVGTVVVIWAAIVPRATAVNIAPMFNDVDNQTPAFDLFNNCIHNLFDYAETFYQDVFKDAGYTLTINFWYKDLEEIILGFFNPVTASPRSLCPENLAPARLAEISADKPAFAGLSPSPSLSSRTPRPGRFTSSASNSIPLAIRYTTPMLDHPCR